MTILAQNPKLGFYRVGDEIFYSKPQAYIRATELGIDPSWHFNTSVYAKIDWANEPEIGIQELYRLRAQQLRNKYDWLRLEFSGGSDSATIAFAFLLNGIHLDEVIFRYPKAGEKDVTNDPFNTNATNTLSEWKFAAQPMLQWIKTNFPKTNIVVHDYSENMLADEKTRDESWVFNTQHWFQPCHADKNSHFGLKEHREMADSGKNIGVILGVDKPKVTILNNEWYSYFSDIQATSANPVINGYTNITSEYFYWTPDFPEISVKQAHLVRNWFSMTQNQHLQHLVSYTTNNTMRRTPYEVIAKSIIYPDYDLTTWQTSKPEGNFYSEMDHWFYVTFRDTNLYRAWEAGLEFLVDKIDNKYFLKSSGKVTGLASNESPLYYLGPVINQPLGVIKNHDYIRATSAKVATIKNKKLVMICV